MFTHFSSSFADFHCRGLVAVWCCLIQRQVWRIFQRSVSSLHAWPASPRQLDLDPAMPAAQKGKSGLSRGIFRIWLLSRGFWIILHPWHCLFWSRFFEGYSLCWSRSHSWGAVFTTFLTGRCWTVRMVQGPATTAQSRRATAKSGWGNKSRPAPSHIVTQIQYIQTTCSFFFLVLFAETGNNHWFCLGCKAGALWICAHTEMLWHQCLAFLPL